MHFRNKTPFLKGYDNDFSHLFGFFDLLDTDSNIQCFKTYNHRLGVVSVHEFSSAIAQLDLDDELDIKFLHIRLF